MSISGRLTPIGLWQAFAIRSRTNIGEEILGRSYRQFPLSQAIKRLAGSASPSVGPPLTCEILSRRPGLVESIDRLLPLESTAMTIVHSWIDTRPQPKGAL